MSRRLVQLKGEASAISLADQILSTYRGLSKRDRLQFFERLLTDFMPDSKRLNDAIAAYQKNPNPNTAAALQSAAESPRQDVFRLLNMGPDGTASIISIREDLRDFLVERPHLAPADADVEHLLQSWCDRDCCRIARFVGRT